jgi:hypothetical protein
MNDAAIWPMGYLVPDSPHLPPLIIKYALLCHTNDERNNVVHEQSTTDILHAWMHGYSTKHRQINDNLLKI